ncbi:RNA polymerase Rpb2, domain 6 [Carpediemonas membranifera]|uniref:DNA-directed RNA polymerase subunit beta n=1 Tax=Carpediemonas membranifera TaxID=201153 RepID=A0A8J6B6C3_9EUKA|nr:RNA polymerase Rpb2, domain 6 [Carpediemonas membranifera]|eukprot:KAG9394004.1 RNA polymerase Rpb2, domain 6 [Carpediemonas membranifera]
MPAVINRQLPIVVQRGQQHLSGVKYSASPEDVEIKMGKVYASTLYSNTLGVIYPNECRLRSLPYDTQLSIDFTSKLYRTTRINGEDIRAVVAEEENQGHPTVFEHRQIPLGRLPVLLRSQLCAITSGLNSIGDNPAARSAFLGGIGECVYDEGAYFIMNGREKVVIAQEQIRNNHVFVFAKASGRYSHTAEVMSTDRNGIQIENQSVVQRYGTGSSVGAIDVKVPYGRGEVPLVLVFRGLSVLTDRDIIKRVIFSNEDDEMARELLPSFELMHGGDPVTDRALQTEDGALAFISKRINQNLRSDRYEVYEREDRIDMARGILYREFLSHVGQGDSSANRKSYYLGYMVHKMLSVVLGRQGPDDRDHYANKRVKMVGTLMTELFRGLFARVRRDLQRRLRNRLKTSIDFVDLTTHANLIDDSIITAGFRYCIGSGNWSADKSAGAATGVTQELNRLSFVSALSHLRRLDAGIKDQGKMTKVRQLHGTQFGYICPAETPEGAQVGLVKNLALLTEVSVGSSVSDLTDTILDGSIEITTIEDMDTADSTTDLASLTKLFINGCWEGVVYEPTAVFHELLERRRTRMIAYDTSIAYDRMNKEIRVTCDAGRVVRPILVVETPESTPDQPAKPQLKLTSSDVRMVTDGRLTWNDLVHAGAIEYVDVDEEECACLVASSINDLQQALVRGDSTYTHCEIHPSALLGVTASLIPFPDHNQSPRNVYQCAMGKQAMGMYVSNFQTRMDTAVHVMHYPQRPLVATRVMRHMHYPDMPAGVNAIVAIMCHTGFNQEDSVLMSMPGVDRGLFRSSYYRTYADATDSHSFGTKEIITNPISEENKAKYAIKRLNPSGFAKLQMDGIVAPGTPVIGGDAVIGKLRESRGRDGSQLRDSSGKVEAVNSSNTLRAVESGVVDRVLVSQSESGAPFIKVRIRSVRVPQIGDKFSSRHGQKGTCGMQFRQEDLPYTIDGVSPDIIINPHAIPSRMTIGQLIECLLGKVGSLKGLEQDATPFTGVTVESIAEELHQFHFNRYGTERMFDGRTGEPMAEPVFVGPTYYQRLKHMVADKLHARPRGPVASLTRQPTEGRARDGGLRFGEMERDAIIAHGSTAFIIDRMLRNSDITKMHVCGRCGLPALANLRSGTYACEACGSSEVVSVIIPYAMKLLMQELTSMNVVPRIRTTDV